MTVPILNLLEMLEKVILKNTMNLIRQFNSLQQVETL